MSTSGTLGEALIAAGAHVMLDMELQPRLRAEAAVIALAGKER